MFLIPLIAIILLIGIVTGSNWFALGACTLLVVFHFARYFSEKWASSIEVERTVSTHETNIGESVQVGLKLVNKTKFFVPWLLLEDTLPKRAISRPNRALELVGSAAKLYFFRPGQLAMLAYKLIPRRRGYFRLGPTLLETGDLLGLHRQHRIVSETNFLLVLPKLIPLEGVNVTTRRPMGELRANERTLDDPTQMVGIRAYRPGDPLNRIHWKATARTGVLHSRVFQPTCLQGAMLVLDMHRDSNPDRNEPMRTDLAVTAAASIIHTLYLMNQPFGLISNGRDAADRFRKEELAADYSNRDAIRLSVQKEEKNDRLKPLIIDAGVGPEKFSEIHRTLARLERTDGLNLCQLLSETQSRLPHQLAILVILQTVNEEAALSLALLRKQGFSVSVIVNQHTLDGADDAAAMLVGQRLPVYALPDEQSVPTVCQNMLLMR